MLKYKRNGDIVRAGGDAIVAHWRKEPDPHYAAGTFRVWMEGTEPEDGSCYWPLYLSKGWVEKQLELGAAETNDNDDQLGL